jgi:protoporphyrinogen oxidase
MKNVAILGGGLAGLSCAFALRERGIPAVVFEASPRAGGRCSGSTYFLGPDVYKNAFELTAALGLKPDLIAIEPVAGQLYKGRVYHHRVSSSLGLLKFQGLNLLDKAMLPRMAYLIARYSSSLDFQHPERGANLDDETVAAFVKRELSQNILNYVAGPLISTLFFYSSEETSKLLYLNIARYMQNIQLYTIRGGLDRLTRKLAEAVTVELDRRDASVAADPDFTVCGRRFTDVVIAVAGNAVLGIPGLAGLLSEADQQFFANCTYGRAVTATFDLEGTIDNCYALFIPRVEQLSSATVVFHQFIDSNSVAPGTSRMTIIGGGDGVRGEALLDGFRRIYGKSPSTVDVREWPSAMPKFPPGRFREIAGFLRRDRRPGLFFCGDYLMGPFIEAAIATGRRAAEAVLIRGQ